MTFRELEEIAHMRGETAIGYYLTHGFIGPTDHRIRTGRGRVILNPPKNEKIPLDPDCIRVVVISAFEN